MEKKERRFLGWLAECVLPFLLLVGLIWWAGGVVNNKAAKPPVTKGSVIP